MISSNEASLLPRRAGVFKGKKIKETREEEKIPQYGTSCLALLNGLASGTVQYLL